MRAISARPRGKKCAAPVKPNMSASANRNAPEQEPAAGNKPAAPSIRNATHPTTIMRNGIITKQPICPDRHESVSAPLSPRALVSRAARTNRDCLSIGPSPHRVCTRVSTAYAERDGMFSRLPLWMYQILRRQIHDNGAHNPGDVTCINWISISTARRAGQR
jgi:hypothetical protein